MLEVKGVLGPLRTKVTQIGNFILQRLSRLIVCSLFTVIAACLNSSALKNKIVMKCTLQMGIYFYELH